MSRAEWAAALALALVAGAAMLIPVACGYRAAGASGRVFLGLIRADDYHRYASFMDQARDEGRFLFVDRSAVEPQRGRILAVFFWTLGLAARLLGLPSVRLFQAMVPISALLLAAAAAPLVRRMDPRPAVRLAGWGLLFLGSGLEWLYQMAGADYARSRQAWMDGYSTFALLHNPLKVTAMAAALAAMGLAAAAGDRPRAGRLAGLAVLVPLLWALHPNTAITAYLALAALAAARLAGGPAGRRAGVLLLAALAPGALAVLGQIAWMRADPVVARVITQYQVPGQSPALAAFPAYYGLQLPLALAGLAVAGRRRQPIDLALVAWTAAALITARLPNLTGLLFAHTLHPAVALAAALGLGWFWERRRAWLRAAGWGLAGLAAAASLAGDAATVAQICRQTAADVWPTRLYFNPDELAAGRDLRAQPPGNLLASRDAGMKLAWLAARPVLAGHWGTTPDRRSKEEAIRRFFAPAEPTAARREILARYQIRYVFYGPGEAALGALDPALGLVEIIRHGDVRVLEVPAEAGGSSTGVDSPAKNGDL